MAAAAGARKAMAKLKRKDNPKRIKLFCGLIGSEASISEAIGLLTRSLGDIDCKSATVQFDFTDYYKREMGEGLIREWVSFHILKERAYLPLAKHGAVAIESEMHKGGSRRVNIDPGYIDDAQVVLSTVKNYSHRIYIGMGYYAEVTLIYEHNAFRQLDWTYPDYRIPEALEFFKSARDTYLSQVRSGLDE